MGVITLLRAPASRPASTPIPFTAPRPLAGKRPPTSADGLRPTASPSPSTEAVTLERPGKETFATSTRQQPALGLLARAARSERVAPTASGMVGDVE
jgi:hypothetical protein